MLNNAITYDTNGRVQQIVDANGNQQVYSYGKATQVQTINSGTVAATAQQNFDSLNRDTGQVDAIGNQTNVFYEDPDNLFKPTRAINRNQQTVHWDYDPTFGNLLSSDMPSNGGRLTTNYSYDYTSFAAGRLASVQVSGKTPTNVTYYTNNTSVTLGGISIPQPNGLVHQVTTAGPGGGAPVTMSYVYTALGNVLTITVPGPNHPVTYTYNYTSDPAFNYTQAEALGEPDHHHEFSLNQTTHYRYDARGNLLSALDSIGRETDYTYNGVDQLLTVQNPASGQTGTGRSYSAYTYLYLGGPLQVTNFYDESGTLVRSVQLTEGKEGEAKKQAGSTEKATLAYDPAYRLKTLIDGNNQASSHTYDLKGNLTQFSHPLANTRYMGFDTSTGVYDKDDNLIQSTDGNLKTTNFTLAPDDSRLTDVVYPANTLSATHYDYDLYGRVIHRSDAAGDYITTYDELDNVMSATTTYTGQPALTVSYTYNPDGSRSTMTTPAGTYSYSYDDGGNLLSVAFPWAQTITYQYDNANRPCPASSRPSSPRVIPMMRWIICSTSTSSPRYLFIRY